MSDNIVRDIITTIMQYDGSSIGLLDTLQERYNIDTLDLHDIEVDQLYAVLLIRNRDPIDTFINGMCIIARRQARMLREENYDATHEYQLAREMQILYHLHNRTHTHR